MMGGSSGPRPRTTPTEPGDRLRSYVALELRSAGFRWPPGGSDVADSRTIVCLCRCPAPTSLHSSVGPVEVWPRGPWGGRPGTSAERQRARGACSSGPTSTAESPLSDSNRRPLPYHGRFAGSRAFTDAYDRARNPCKQAQYGVYGCGGRFTVVVDLVDAERTRCARRFVFSDLQADTGPLAGRCGPPSPPDAS